MYFGFFNFSPTELIVVLLIILVIFGPKKLPDIGRAFGEMLTNFKKGQKDDEAPKDSPKDIEKDKDNGENQ